MDARAAIPEEARKKAGSYARSMAPWNKDLPWYWVGIEGAVALGIGLYFIFAPDAASNTVRTLLALLLILASALDIITGFRNHSYDAANLPMTPYLLVRGGAGVALGLGFFLAARSDYLTSENALIALAYGYLAYAIIGIIGNVMSLLKGDMLWFSIVTNLLFLGIGAVLIYNRQESVAGDNAVRYIGYASTVGGIVLLAYTYFLKSGQEAEEAAALTAEASVDSLTAEMPETPVTGIASEGKATIAPPVTAEGLGLTAPDAEIIEDAVADATAQDSESKRG